MPPRTVPFADLHLHTLRSDGTDEPAALIRAVAKRGIRVAAVTDHDTTDGCDEAIAEGRRVGVRVVAGIELSSARDGKEVHVLGLFLDTAAAGFQRRLRDFRADRVRRARRIVAKLRQLGLDVVFAPLRAIARTGTAVGRPHVARQLVARGYVGSIPEAFDRYLGIGRPAYVGKAPLTPEGAIAFVHAAGGLAFVAHPGPLRRDDLIPGLARAGLDGIEAHHSDHDSRSVRRYRAMAAAHGLLVSGGSDYHGTNKHRSPLGSGGISEDDFARLEAALESRRREAPG